MNQREKIKTSTKKYKVGMRYNDIEIDLFTPFVDICSSAILIND
jgi:hypothetical protein